MTHLMIHCPNADILIVWANSISAGLGLILHNIKCVRCTGNYSIMDQGYTEAHAFISVSKRPLCGPITWIHITKDNRPRKKRVVKAHTYNVA